MPSTFNQFNSQEVRVGNLVLGGKHPVRIQSMVNTNTLDAQATVKQVLQLARAGCEMVRITAPGVREAEHLAVIKNELHIKGCRIPLIADIHFNPKAAEVAARFVAKVRINPGNYVDRRRGKTAYTEKEYDREMERIAERLYPLLRICRENGTAVRIGTNHGSLSERILFRYGNTAEGMVESAMEFVQICQDFGFRQLVLSLKSSRVAVMLEANRLLAERLIQSGNYFPLHLGVTEAGSGEEARIKSAAGIGSLLAMGIGDTIRVSLAEDPVAEIPVARKLVELYGKKQGIVTAPVVRTGKGRTAVLKYPGIPDEELLIRPAVDFALLLQEKKVRDLQIDNGPVSDENRLEGLRKNILQALGLRRFKTEFIACPSCGRTRFDLMETLETVKQRTSHLKGLSIAVMGCIVNGPGEMAGADYGYVGMGPGKVTLYKGEKAVVKNIAADQAVEALIDLIRKEGDRAEDFDV